MGVAWAGPDENYLKCCAVTSDPCCMVKGYHMSAGVLGSVVSGKDPHVGNALPGLTAIVEHGAIYCEGPMEWGGDSANS